MKKLTSLPWKADKDNWIRDCNGRLIIHVNLEWRSEEEIFAIRDLLTAAPEMAEMLKNASCSLYDRGDVRLSSEIDDLLKKAGVICSQK